MSRCTQGFHSVGEVTFSGVRQLVKSITASFSASLNVFAQHGSSGVPDLHLLLHVSAVSAILVSADLQQRSDVYVHVQI